MTPTFDECPSTFVNPHRRTLHGCTNPPGHPPTDHRSDDGTCWATAPPPPPISLDDPPSYAQGWLR